MSELRDRAEMLCERVKNIHAGYTDKCLALYSKVLGGGTLGLLTKVITGNDALSSSTAHEEYFNEMKDASEALAGGLEELAAEDREAAGDIAAEAVDLLLTPATEEYQFMEFSYMADDQHAGNLIKYLTNEKLRSVYEWMLKDSKRMLIVPGQEKTAAAIKSEILARGLELPSWGLMDKLKARFKKK